MHLQKIAVFLCGLVLFSGNTNAQACISGTKSTPTNYDPHYFTLCVDGKEVLTKCPSSTLYAQKVTDLVTCDYGGCSLTVGGCVSWQQFPWPKPPSPSPSQTAPACVSVGPVGPYSDPSYYWFCTSIYGTAELRACPSGYGFATSTRFGCVIWYYWNTEP